MSPGAGAGLKGEVGKGVMGLKGKQEMDSWVWLEINSRAEGRG